MQKLFNQCPACGSPLVITECNTPPVAPDAR